MGTWPGVTGVLTVCQRRIYNVYENLPVLTNMTFFVRKADSSGLTVV